MHCIKEKEAYIQVAFRQDCEALLQEFVLLRTFSYSIFAALWKKMEFSLVYRGSKAWDILCHKTESFLFEAKKFLLFGGSIYMKTGGLYLLYGLYFKQPLQIHVKIRLTIEDFDVLQTFINEIIQRRKLEVFYVYEKLKNSEAFHCVYTQNYRSPELQRTRKNFELKNDIFTVRPVNTVWNEIKNIIENGNTTSFFEQYRQAFEDYVGSINDMPLMTFKGNIQEELKSIFESV